MRRQNHFFIPFKVYNKMKKTDEPILIQATYESSIEKVWSAITEVAQMKKWFFEQINAFEPVEGFETKFVVAVEGRTFTHLWKIADVVLNQKIKYNWKYEEYAGDSFVTFELEEKGNHVALSLTTEVTKDFPPDVPEFTRESCIGGWNYFIKERLKGYLKSV